MALDRNGGASGTGTSITDVDLALAAHIDDSVDAHDASAISILDTTNDFTATDVEGALAELQADAEAHLASTTAHTAANIVNVAAGGIAATTVQAAINELDTEKAPLASPALTGTPTAPTAAADTNTTQIATTAFVQTEIAAAVTGKNRIINGDMRIDQRNAFAAVAAVAGGTTYGADRWQAFEDTDGGFTTASTTSTPPSGFSHYLRVTVTSADASLAAGQFAIICQKIEGVNTYDLGWGAAGAQSITLSFRVRSSLAGTFGGSVKNSASNRSYPFTYTISAANTWETKTVTIPGDTSGTWLTTTGIGIQLTFSLGVGSIFTGTAGAWAASGALGATGETSVIGTNGATWDITGVQMEQGVAATDFERRPYGHEFMLCQRYYQVFGGLGNFMGVRSYGAAGDFDQRSYLFPVQMRAAPTGTKNGTWTVFNCAQPTVSSTSKDGVYMSAQITALGGFYYIPDSADDTVTFSAEL